MPRGGTGRCASPLLRHKHSDGGVQRTEAVDLPITGNPYPKAERPD